MVREAAQMPYAVNQGVLIHYRIEGDGQPLVLQHGFTDSLETWYETGYVEGLKTDYRLILIDARGHGASDKSHESDAYGRERNVDDITSVLDDLDIPRAHYFGYSMGGVIGFAFARYAPERVHSLVIGVGSPYPQSQAGPDRMLEALKQGAEAIPSLWDAPLPPAVKDRLVKNDVEALIALPTKALQSPGFAEILPTMTMPCLLFAGEDDPNYAKNKECIRSMPNVTFFSLPGLGHVDVLFRSDLVLPHIAQFLAKATR
jgi:pimeloyl-ACP methyl ester carboxylesterase